MQHNALAPARHPNESFQQYRARRKGAARLVAAKLRGTMVHVSSEAVRLPAPGVDSDVDAKVARGDVRDVELCTDALGKEYRVGRMRGKTYRKPKS